MVANCARADDQFGSDLLVGIAACNECCDLPLTSGERFASPAGLVFKHALLAAPIAGAEAAVPRNGQAAVDERGRGYEAEHQVTS
jgi:hypothetical protein